MRTVKQPKALPRATKSGLANFVCELWPKPMVCFHLMRPYSPSSHTTCTQGTPYIAAVASSCTFIMNPPSPCSATTLRSGWTIFAEIEPGRAPAIEQKPLEMMQVLGS